MLHREGMVPKIQFQGLSVCQGSLIWLSYPENTTVALSIHLQYGSCFFIDASPDQ